MHAAPLSINRGLGSVCGQVLDAFDDFDGDSDSEKPTLKPSNLHERSPLPSSCVRYSGTPGLRGVLGYSRAARDTG